MEDQDSMQGWAHEQELEHQRWEEQENEQCLLN